MRRAVLLLILAFLVAAFGYCKDFECQNGGTPAERPNSKDCYCKCRKGFSGEHCEVDGREPPECPPITEGRQVWPRTPGGSTAQGECLPGTKGRPSRYCRPDGTWGKVSNPCFIIRCPAGRSNHANFPTTEAGNVAQGTCHEGYVGNPTRRCDIFGGWGAVRNPCVPDSREPEECPSERAGGAQWPRTPAGDTVTKKCPNKEQEGHLSRKCKKNGEWGPVQDNCEDGREPEECPSERAGGVLWPRTPAGDTVTKKCPNKEQEGHISRKCKKNGEWGQVENTCGGREPGVCPPITEDNNVFPRTPGGSDAFGTCTPGYKGRPSRYCRPDGTWGPIFNPCFITKCEPENAYHSHFPRTNAGSVAQGTCHDGYTGSPSRRCFLNGVWGAVQNPCVLE